MKLYKQERENILKIHSHVKEATGKNGNRISFSLGSEDENSNETDRHLAYDEQRSCFDV